jgi:RES domain-containing protein
MILTSIGPDAPFHRAFTPRWAHAPESGAGAALAGGRFNRPGVEARYLAATPETALAEYQGESPLLPPATLVTFLVTAKNVVDARYRDAAERLLGDPPWFYRAGALPALHDDIAGFFLRSLGLPESRTSPRTEG